MLCAQVARKIRAKSSTKVDIATEVAAIRIAAIERVEHEFASNLGLKAH